MPTKPAEKPAWATSAALVITPPGGKQTTGWVPLDEPPAQFQNWLHYWTWKWINYFEAITDEDTTQVGILQPLVATLSGDMARVRRRVKTLETENKSRMFYSAIF